MKKSIVTVCSLFLLFGFTHNTSGLTPKEREMALKHLIDSKNHFMEVLNGLDEVQLNFKPSSEAWSIAECTEHITVTELAFDGLLKATVAEGNIPALKDSVQLKDEEIFELVANRTQKVKTAEQFEPSGKFSSHSETVAAFNKKRAEFIDYVKTTDDDLRNRFNSNLPFGTVDGFQLLLFISGHCERHVLQMEEIMAHADFAKQ